MLSWFLLMGWIFFDKRKDAMPISNDTHSPSKGKRMELQRGKQPATEKSRHQRKLDLLQDVDNLKKKLRQEENVHRALERAFTRPSGALPRLPAYLPQYTLELLAKVAVLEKEVVRLEEKILHFRQGLYQEAVYLSSRKSSLDSTPSRKELLTKTSKQRRESRSSSYSEINLKSLESRSSSILSRVASTIKFLPETHVSDGLRHCPQSLPNANHQQKDKSLVRRDQLKIGIMEKNVKSPKIQYRKVEQSQEISDNRAVDAESEANTTSQDILRCLISIFIKLSSFTGMTMDSECW